MLCPDMRETTKAVTAASAAGPEAAPIPVEEALELLLKEARPPDAGETVSLPDALGRVAFEEVRALADVPPFDRSPLDGYAADHRDIAGASSENPAILRVTRKIYAGDAPGGPISRGEAALVATGTPLPPNATCVVRQEDTDRGEETVRVFRSAGEHENYCFRGEDVREGGLLAERGERLDGVRLGLAAGQGKSGIKVFPRPAVGVLSVGDELLAPGMPPVPGKIYDSNGCALSSRVRELGALPVSGAILPDDPRALAEAVGALLPGCALLVTTGGVSVGERDYVPRVGEMLGARTVFRGIAMKPGGRAMALKKDGKLLFCLSGNPFAAYAVFELLTVPVLKKLAGEASYLPEKTVGHLAEGFDKPSPERRFLRARIEGGRVFIPKTGHAAGVLSSLAGCNCLADIPAGSPRLARGEAVRVILFRS